MKRIVFACACAVMAGVASAEPDRVRANWFETEITPPVGVRLAGYGDRDFSVGKYDELVASGLCLDDGKGKIMLISLDLLGLDYDSIVEIRRRVSSVTGIPTGGIMVSCTHTHQGPHTWMYSKRNAIGENAAIDERPGSEDWKYRELLFSRVTEAAKGMMDGDWKDCIIGYYSQKCDENRNRRYTTSENRASFNAHRPFLHDITTEIADKELGTIVLLDRENRPLYVVGNYGAHPLTSHSPGYGGLRISSDYPGFYRRAIEEETGAKAMFVTGAAGNLVTKEDECGNMAARKVGENLAKASIIGIISIQRCNDRYAIAKPRVGWESRTFTSPLRKRWRDATGEKEHAFEVQCLAVGDVCFVGLPGEVVTELGLEVKWNSPFARTYIAFLATGYSGYVVPPNLMAAGGYESQSHRFASRDTLKMVKTASDAMFDLRSRLFPEDDVGDDRYPDNRKPPIVNVPGMYKGTKGER